MAGIRVRMYRVGFGDCFLITLTDDGGQAHHVLVDCGVHFKGNAGTMDDVVADIAKETGGNLALVVATHSHQDHISGFGSHADAFRAMTAREVWMPWVDDPSDAQAKSYREMQMAMLMHLEGPAAFWVESQNVRDHAALAAVMNLRGNAKALDTLRRGFKGAKVRYLEATDRLLENAAGVPGLTVSILGPTRDEDFLELELPPRDDRFFRAVQGGNFLDSAPKPFAKGFIHERHKLLNPYVSNEDRDTIEDILDDDASLAFRLERAKNNTSLVLLFSFAGQHMLFAGDAQYGSWQSWRERPDRDEILRSLTFYKVSHHGSHNATPRSAVEAMAESGIMAMMSTQNQPWATIPDLKLLNALGERAQIVRTDATPDLFIDWKP